MTATLTPPLKTHGGKSYLAKRIVALMPAHTHYVEPFAGGLAVMLAKSPEGVSEVANDLHGELMTFWRVLQSPQKFKRFRRRIEATPFSEVEWRTAKHRLNGQAAADPVWRAVWFFITCRQSMSGRCDSFAPLSRARTRRGMNEQASAWLTAVDGLPAVHARLKRVAILNKPALDVIRQEDGPATLFYLDPPYLAETRTAPAVYSHEMGQSSHRKLLEALQSVQGKAMLSGYTSPLYDDALEGWTKHTFDLPNNSAAGKSKERRIECLWCNF